MGARDRQALAVREDIVRGRSRDRAFDALYPAKVRAVSRTFWTPVAVARRAAQLFARWDVKRVLDVGCGPGKFCIVGALCEPELDVLGVDHRAELIDSARSIGARMDVRNARFAVGNATEMSWSEFDGYYFYNPFGENVFAERDRYDAGVELSAARFRREISAAEDRIGAAPIGTVLVTLHRFGGRIPSTYDLLFEEELPTGWLRAWRKVRSVATGVHFEVGHGVYFRPYDANVSLHAASRR